MIVWTLEMRSAAISFADFPLAMSLRISISVGVSSEVVSSLVEWVSSSSET